MKNITFFWSDCRPPRNFPIVFKFGRVVVNINIGKVKKIGRPTASLSLCRGVYQKPRVSTFPPIHYRVKGPIPSATKNKYLFVVVDEFSRYTWAIPCKDVETKTVIECLVPLFSAFGLPNYIHSDRGTSLISAELSQFLHSRGIATSNSSRYHPTGNSQVERFNGVIWRSITSTLDSHNLPITHWESVLPDVLHAQRSLLCTATNCTPHERMFTYPRKTATGASFPSWLQPGRRVLVKRHVRGKYDPLADDADLLQINPTYSRVRLSTGREVNVSIRDLAPLPEHCSV